MKKLWQASNLKSSFTGAVGGLSGSAARYVKQNHLFSQSKDGEEQQFLRLPIESARKLRWYDRGELSQIVLAHAQERQELEDVNDSLREMLAETALTKEKIGSELITRIKRVDEDRAAQDSVGAVLLESLKAALDEARAKSISLENMDRDSLGSGLTTNSEKFVEVSMQVEGDKVAINLQILQETPTKTGHIVDFRKLEALADRVLHLLRDCSGSSEASDESETQASIDGLTELLTGISASLSSTAELRKEVAMLQARNQQLSASIEEFRKKHKEGPNQHVPADVLAKAQGMCAAANEKARAFQRRSELAEMRAQKSEQSEQSTQRELQRLRVRNEEYVLKIEATEQSRAKLSDRYSDLGIQNDSLAAHTRECEEKLAEMAAELSEAQEGLVERDELAFHVNTLEDTVRDLASKAEMSDNYRQLVRELEQSRARAEEELLSTARAVTDAEKKLKKSESACRKHEERCSHLENKYKYLEQSIESEVCSRMESAATDEARWPSAAHDEVSRLQEELRLQLKTLRIAESNVERAQAECFQALEDKEELLHQIQEVELKAKSADKEKASLVMHLRRQVALSQKDLAERQEAMAELEKEHHNVLKTMKAQASRAALNGSLDARGSGNFSGAAWICDETKRVEVSGIDTLYLKNVVFKFIEATANGRAKERDALLPVVSTVLQASPQEFRALKLAVDSATNDSYAVSNMRKRPSSQASIKSFFAPVSSAESSQAVASCPIAKRPKTNPASSQAASLSAASLEAVIPDRNPHRHAAAQRKLVGGGASWNTGSERNVGVVKETKKYTPLEQQVVKLKKQYPGVILIIEVGYKMRLFGEDAEVASKCCNFYCYPDHNFMTTSFPVPRLPIHVRRLVENGHKVGVVRQMESAAAKSTSKDKYSVFQRKLVSMHTRATLDAGEIFEIGMDYGGAGVGGQGGSSQLLCIVEGDQDYGMVAVEASTGEVRYGTYRVDITDHEVWSILLRIAPQEIVMVNCVDSRMGKLVKSYISSQQGGRIESFTDTEYQEHRVVEKVAEFYGDTDTGAQCELELVLSFPRLVLVALCAAKDYLAQFNVESVLKVASTFKVLAVMQEMQLSGNALVQLEILQNSLDGGRQGSLLHLMDQTRTAAGSRQLRYWLCHPLADMALIRDRHDAVEELLTSQFGVVKNIPEVLGKIPDLEKGLARVLHKTTSPSECAEMLLGFQLVCQQLAPGEGSLASSSPKSTLLASLVSSATSHDLFSFAQSNLCMINLEAAKQNDSINVFVDEGRFEIVFQAKKAVHDAEQHLKGLLPELAKQVGMHRVSYTSVMNQGNYLIEVPCTHRHIPATWNKVCSTKKVDRYHTPEIKSGMLSLDLAKDQLVSAAKQAWSDFLSLIVQQYVVCRSAVQALAVLDVLHSFAVLALLPQYTRPKIIGEEGHRQLVITGGRHPILDSILDGSAVANDAHLTRDGQRALIVTGPNMGGKSCYIKLVALTVIMAQVGSFVPAESVSMHAFDAVFTRMGASDNIQMGKSTFLEELSDASTILSNATDRSLVVMDELGRGTATYDGVAIAQATLEFLVNEVQCLTCFVTHYPEVAKMENDFPGTLVAYHMSYTCLYQENSDRVEAQKALGKNQEKTEEEQLNKGSKILFLYKLIQGAAGHSFGLNVAQMAGLPRSTISIAKDRAEEAANFSSVKQDKVDTLKYLLDNLRAGMSQSEIMKRFSSWRNKGGCLGDVEIDGI